jgi:hypothetical protein
MTLRALILSHTKLKAFVCPFIDELVSNRCSHSDAAKGLSAAVQRPFVQELDKRPALM